MEYKIIREKLDNDGNEAVCPKIEEEFSEDENKTIIHQLIGADGKILNKDLSFEDLVKNENVEDVSTSQGKTLRLQCINCDYQASRKCVLSRHIRRVHLGINNYKCSQCNYQTTVRGALKRHISSVHLGIKSFKCDHCDYQTSFKGHLKNI
ncbi:hypothetical protein HHI36_020796 [Cryptolaemus montrouzieri]|uniref:C2H2-type domain-containing protein n=1 Tax=Cryptolaemus montrouzieri TaxID=559131 RepID=A0ABD2NBA9_9CUCU